MTVARFVQRKAADGPRASKPRSTEPDEDSAGSPRYVQALVQPKCAACEETQPVQARCDTCDEEPASPVQLWNCHEYSAPTCTEESVQSKCESCEQEDAGAPEPMTVQHDRSGGASRAAGATGSRTRSPQMIHSAARDGLAGASQRMPHADRIQAAFGRHDVSHVRASIGGAAAGASQRMGALAFTSGDRIGFRESPDLRLAAHEAAHVVQQRSGLKLPGGVGRSGDRWERHADSVADAVVAGHSAEALLDEVAQPGSSSVTPPVQRQITPPSQHLHEPPPAPVAIRSHAAPAPAAASGGPPGGAAQAPQGQEPPIEAARQGEQSEAPPEGASPTGGPAPAPGAGPGGAGGGGAGGGISAPCYNAASPAPPNPDQPQPTSDQRSTQSEDEASVTRDPWPVEADVCQADSALAQGGQQLARQGQTLAARAPGGPAAAPAAPGGAGGGGAPGTAAASPAAQSTQPAAAASGAPGADASSAPAGAASRSSEVRQMSSAAATAADQSASQASAMDGSIAEAEAQRSAAWVDYDGSRETLAGIPGRASRLSQGISFGENGEPAANQLRAFMAGAEAQIGRAVAFAQSEVPTRLGGLATTTNANIAGAMEIEKQVISARIDQARGLAFAGAEAARGHVEAEYASSALTIEAETLAAIVALDAEHLRSIEQIHTRQTTGLDNVNTRFAAGRRQHEAKGPEYSQRAIARGQVHVGRYERCKRGPGNNNVMYGDDGFWDGCLTVRRARAQQDAACKTAAGMKKGFLRTANDKAYDLLPLRRQYRCAVISGARQVSQTLDQTHAQLVSGLENSRIQALAQLATARTQNLAAIDAALEANLRSLATQEFTQRQAIDDTGYLKQLAVEQLAHAGAAGLVRGITAAMESLDQVLTGLRERVTRGATPDPATVAAALAPIQASLGGGMELLLAGMQDGATDAESRIAQLGTATLGALTGITTTNDQTTAQGEAGFSSQIGGLMAGATSSFAQLTGNHVRQCHTTSTQGVATMRQAVTGFDTALATIGTQVDDAIASSLADLDRQLGTTLAGLDARIAYEAWKAAEKEQPAWKSVVAIILVVLVIIAAAIISIVTLGAGASLFAIILVGAIVGAISAGLIQIINNWASGQSWHEGLAQAMIMGAIGGAIGGAVGFGAGGLAAAAGSAGARVVTQLAIHVGGDLVAEGLTQVAGRVLFGQKFNWQGFVMAGAMSGLSFRATPARPRAPTPHAATPHVSSPHAGGPHVSEPHVGGAHPVEAPHAPSAHPTETPHAPAAHPTETPHAPAAHPTETPHAGGPHETTPHGAGAPATRAPAAGGRGAAVARVAGGALLGIGLEYATSRLSGEHFDLTRAASAAAGAALAAHMSRAGGHGGSEPPREPTTRAGRALERFRGLGRGTSERLQRRIDRLGARIGGEPLPPRGARPPSEPLETRAGTRSPEEVPDVRPRAPDESHDARPRAPDEAHEMRSPQRPDETAAPGTSPRDAEPHGRRPEDATEPPGSRHPEDAPEARAARERPEEGGHAPGRHEEAVVGRSVDVTIGGEQHSLTVRQMGDRLVVICCSNQCGEILLKIRRMQAHVEPGTPAWRDLEALAQLAHNSDAIINGVNPRSDAHAVQAADDALGRLRSGMREIESRHPGLVDPDIPVGPGTGVVRSGAPPAPGRGVDIQSHLPTGAEPVGAQVRIDLSEGVTIPPALRNLEPGVEFVYAVRDNITGEILKVGETADITTRAGVYERAARLHAMGRSVSMEVQPVRVGTAAYPTAASIETHLRTNVEAAIAEQRGATPVPHDTPIMPWDVTGGRLPAEPRGPGTPGVTDATMRDTGAYWSRERKWTAEAGPAPAAPPRELPSWAVVRGQTTNEALANARIGELLRQHGGNQAAVERALGTRGTLASYLRARGLTVQDLMRLPPP